MDLNKILENNGLSEKEAKVYLTLLELKEALPSSISRRSGIKRPTTYVVLDQLQKKGLVSYVKKGKWQYFQAINPHSLLEKEYNRYHGLELALPELLQLHQRYAVTPQMQVFEGKAGLIQIMEDTLTTKTELLVWANTTAAVMSCLKDYYPEYIRKKVERGIWVRGVVCDDKLSVQFKERGKAELRELYLIPEKDFPFKNEINIYDDKVAIVSHEDEIGVIIRNQNIADTQRAIFKLGFEYAKILGWKGGV
ncbi:hypothetical protein COY07_03625 [Candidatus Peregrinibacteria bacterium CG_4_10_14_0_2_um_filter_43_11]|nr:MAG: hypothetical protein COY07_03625 [Candidatus Peregrinibacteria bacterium CG_4_10_14_0_2_um_filter_43_11]